LSSAAIFRALLRRPPRVADLQAAIWAWQALHSARQQLQGGAVRGVRVPEPSPLPIAASRAVRVVLTARKASCLERALLHQRWLAAHGIERDVVVGTRGGAGDEFCAHAWVDGTPQGTDRRFVEMIRLAP
jgi:hypothetical protein